MKEPLRDFSVSALLLYISVDIDVISENFANFAVSFKREWPYINCRRLANILFRKTGHFHDFMRFCDMLTHSVVYFPICNIGAWAVAIHKVRQSRASEID